MSEDIRRCTMSAYLDEPFRCGSYSCPKDETCGAVNQNRREAEWLERNSQSWEQAWAEAYGEPPLTRRDARHVVMWS